MVSPPPSRLESGHRNGILDRLTPYNTRETLLLKIRDHDDAVAWGQFVELYTPLVFTFCRKRGLAEHDASDVSQEVMRAISRAIGNFDYDPETGSFRSWFYTVVRSKLNNHFRKQAQQPVGGGTTMMEMVNEQPNSNEEHDWELDYKRQMFEWATARVREIFNEQTWTAFWRTAIDGDNPATVGTDLGIGRGAVYAAKARVIRALRERIQSVAGEWDLNVI